MIDVVVLNYNDAETTILFVESVKNFNCVNHILVVDNKSTDDSFEKLQTLKSDKVVVVQTDHNGGYGAGNNFGIRYLREYYSSEYILLSNPDVIVAEDVLSELEFFLRDNQDYAIVAPFMLDSKGVRMYNTAFRVPSMGEYILSLEILFSKFVKSFYYKGIVDEKSDLKTVGSVSGSMFLMNAEKMLKYGMFDENIFLYCEEMVLGLKLKNCNQKVALLPHLSFVHNHSVSISKSYKSIVSKHKLLMRSKLFVIKNYFKANKFTYGLAFLLSRISILEVWLMSAVRGMK